MSKRYFWLVIISTLYVLSMDAQNNRENELIIQLEAHAKIEQVIPKFLPISSFKCCSATLNIYSITIKSRNELSQVFAELKDIPEIIHVQKNHEVTWRQTPNDAAYNLQSNQMELINTPDIWDLTTGGVTPEGDTIVIAVIDDGFDIDHDDLSENIWRNRSETPNDGIDNDVNGYIDDYHGYNFNTENDSHENRTHGSAVCGLIGGIGDNEIGIAGLNWNIKMMTLSGARFESDVIEAYSYILSQRRLYNQTNGALGAFVVATNASFGISNAQPEDHPLWCSIYNSLGFEGILNVAATSNFSVNVDEEGDMPTACQSDFLLTVTNIDVSDSSVGAGYGIKNIDIAAPGENIYTTVRNNNYGNFGGTSGATPLVSGAIGLLYSLYCPSLIALAKSDPPNAVRLLKNSIVKGAREIPAMSNRSVSEGVLDLSKTVDEMKSFCEQPNPVSSTVYNVFPNPIMNHEILSITFAKPTKKDMVLQISNTFGQVIETHNTPDFSYGLLQLDLEITHLNPGIYFISFLHGAGSTVPFVVVRD